MTIYRIEHKDQYFALSNEVVNNPAISFKAKGILAYLLSKPNDWRVYQEDIVKHSTDGKASVRAGINELISAGYICRKQVRGEAGRIKEWEYMVCELPQSDFQQLENQDLENRTLQSTDTTNNGLQQILNKDNGVANATHTQQTMRFFEWYTKACYPQFKGAEHPQLKKRQRERVMAAIDQFIQEFEVDFATLADMATKYFEAVKDCDHNINHFVSDGVLLNRFYEVAY